MQERKSNPEGARPGQFNSREAALAYVARQVRGEAEMATLYQEVQETQGYEGPIDPADAADSALINFLSPEWPGTEVLDLYRVERGAIYLAIVPPTMDELSSIGMYRGLVDLIRAKVVAEDNECRRLEKALRKPSGNNPLRRGRDEVGRCDERVIHYIESWSDTIVHDLRVVERRAAYLRMDHMLQPEDVTALLMFRELLQRVEAYVVAYESTKPAASSTRRRDPIERREPATSAN